MNIRHLLNIVCKSNDLKRVYETSASETSTPRLSHELSTETVGNYTDNDNHCLLQDEISQVDKS
ncbi:hypothetical protein OLEAN_C33020 [Oleispira antarctica RB-8]|uniref:Uncharacterized protein n=1 Tax=Oleispira antarctica RB-8 TaxID=698738 RepID=R4YU24_OLEAN|nr:hypothetical protein OLEAN_C33020 [Oleispira antarctica RB-8]